VNRIQGEKGRGQDFTR